MFIYIHKTNQTFFVCWCYRFNNYSIKQINGVLFVGDCNKCYAFIRSYFNKNNRKQPTKNAYICALVNVCSSHLFNKYKMKTIFIDLNTKETIVFSVKTDLCKKLGICPATLWNWSKETIKQTKEYIICFDATEYKNKSKVRRHGF